jgi:acyl carrier protein
MQRDEVDTKVRAIFEELFGIDPASLTDDSSPDTVKGWDSLQHINLIASLEEQLGIALTDEQVVEMLSFGLIVEIAHAELETSKHS